MHDTPRYVWTYPRMRAWGALLTFVALAVLSVALLGSISWALLQTPPAGDAAWTTGEALALLALLVALAAWFAVILRHLFRNLRGRWRGRIVLTDDALDLDLAGDRSLLHRTPRFVGRISLTDVAAIETRTEAYAGRRLAMVQQSWRIVRRTGEPIFLFEDRGLGSRLHDGSHAAVVRELAARGRIPLRDLGMVAGEIGFLGVLGARAPAWDARRLSARDAEGVWDKVGFTDSIGR